MKIYDIDNLKKDDTGSYDLSQLTFKHRNDVEMYSYVVQQGEEMRIDLISESIYGSVEYVDILMHINYIDNPLNIKEGVTIMYPSPSKIELFRIVEEKKQNVQNKIVNTNKTTKKDKNRESYLSQGYSLPPVVLEKPADPVRIEGSTVVIGGNNF